jgi:hypothetical protein
MKSVLRIALSQLALLSMVACGSSSSGGSCSFTAQGSGGGCEDFVGSGYTSSTVMTDCSKGNGTYSSSACPTAGALGSCVLLGGTPAEGKITYYATDGGPSASDEQSACTQEGGTWTAS